MRTISAEEYKKQYGEAGVQAFNTQATPQEQPGLFSRIGTDLSKRVSDVATSFKKEVMPTAGLDMNPLEKVRFGARALGAVGGGITDVIGEGVKSLGDVTGISSAISDVTKPVGLAILDTDWGKAGLEAIKGGVETYNQFKQAHPDVANGLEDVINIASLLPVGKGVQVAKNAATDITKVGVNAIETGIKDLVPKVGTIVDKAPANIMQRVARIPKGAQADFQKLAGESVGEYLAKRDIFGNVDTITEKLFNRFKQSKNTADEALAGLTGTFEPSPVKTALEELLAREKRVSAQGAPSPNLARTQELINKFDTQGLTMQEINEAKRLYESNVKLDFSKLINPEGVARANNIDNAIRTWQFSKAEELGLKNLPAINKETQLAKNLLDSLGKEYYGAAGNNLVGLTDWVVLSGGDPTAMGSFLVKKIFSDKSVQSAVAKYLNKGKAVMGDVKADIGTSRVKQLPAPTTNFRTQTPTGKTIKVPEKGKNIDVIQ